MREAVTSGSARSANVPGAPVYGQTALVQTGSGRSAQWQSWFVGYRGDVAFTVLASSQSPQISASVLAAQFLSALTPADPAPLPTRYKTLRDRKQPFGYSPTS